MANLGTALECQHCGRIVTVKAPGEVRPCPDCQGRYWRTVEYESDIPRVAYQLTREDVVLLLALRIDPEQPWPPDPSRHF